MSSTTADPARFVTPLGPGVARQLGSYELLGRLGVGGMAEVFLARQPLAGGRLCVLKRVRPEFLGDAAALAMFFEEGRLGMALEHQHIAKVFDAHHSSEGSYLVMEWVPGITLRQLVAWLQRRQTALDVHLVAQVIADCAGALQAAHTARSSDGQPLHIVHRDVSPHNILVSNTGVTKLIDFGIARASSRALSTQRGIVKGKAFYMSPEQLRDEPLDIRSDLFSLGLVMYELLTAVRALRVRSELEMLRSPSWDIAPIEAHRGDVPVELRFICWKLVSLEPAERFAEPRALLKMLRPIVPASALAERRAALGELVAQVVADTTLTPAEPTAALAR
ncbi:MAG: serine/threonine-protein kinase [Myxococcaceae bacterium]|nr:serine/threonine-protein kinase [Myxococcaceae bacterium]